MRHSHTSSRRAQKGAVLIVALIMLAVLTLFVISMLKTSVIELKIGGSSQVAAINLSNANGAIDNFIALNSGRFAPGFLALAQGAGGPITTSLAYSAYTGSISSGNVTLTPVQLSCGPPLCPSGGCQYGSLNVQSVFFDIRAAATGLAGFGSASSGVVVHQGVTSYVGAGACP